MISPGDVSVEPCVELEIQSNFIELHAIIDESSIPFIVNKNKIAYVFESKGGTAKISFSDESEPLTLYETYDEMKTILLS